MKNRKNTKAIATYAMVSALVLSATGLPVKAVGQWQQTNGVWNYTNEGKVTTGWQEIDNNWYSFDETGKMQTGWIASAEHWYFLGGSGIMQNDAWVTDTDGSKFYIKGTGVMATDYVKDGFELTADGKAIPLADSNSVVLTDLSNLEGTTIEGNLYVDATLAKELLIKGVTVTGKLVLLGDNKTTTKLTITDSDINAISTQTRDSEIVLSGTTSVKSVVLQETTKVTPNASFKGQVDTIEVQSTTKGEVVVSVPAKEVSSRTFATVDIQAPVDKLDIKTNTTVNINADVKEVAINEFAAGTKVEVSKGNTVGKIDTEVKIEVSGSGNVDRVTGAGKDESIVTPKPERPTTGGGGTVTPTPTVPDGVQVGDASQFINALKNTSEDIVLTKDISVSVTDFPIYNPEDEKIVYAINRDVVINLNNRKLTLTGEKSIRISNASNVSILNGYIVANDLNVNKGQAAFSPEAGSSITLQKVDFKTSSVALYPRGDTAEVNVTDSTIIAGLYGVSTNAEKVDNYNVNINITNSIIKAIDSTSTDWPKESSAILMNVPGNLTITDSELTGDRQGLIVRGGTAKVSNTTITYTNVWATQSGKEANSYFDVAWGTGNDVPAAPVVIGNVHDKDYLYPTDVTFENVTIEGFVTIAEEGTVDAVDALSEPSQGINGTQVVVAANTLYDNQETVKVSFTSDEPYKTYVISAEGKEPTINMSIVE